MGPLLRASRTSSLLALFALAAAPLGCDGEPPPAEPPAASTAAAPATAAPTTAAPPAAGDNPAAALGLPQIAAAHVVVRAAGNCQEWTPGRPPRTVSCPADLQDGETIRFLTSTTCSRVGLAGREGNVPCPELTSP